MSKLNIPSESELQQQIQKELKKLDGLKYPQKDDLLHLYQVVDHTSLKSTDGPNYIDDWLTETVLKTFQKNSQLKPASVFVFPNFTKQIAEKLKDTGIKLGTVSAHFPSGQTLKEIKELETKLSIGNGAEEIDMVVSRGYWNEGKHDYVLQEIKNQREICGEKVNLKVILETNELKDLQSIYQLSFQTFEQGADFIKTSTGKGGNGARIEHFVIMCLAAKDYEKEYGYKKGVKAVGYIYDAYSAFKYSQVAFNILGRNDKQYFRIGSSSLLNDILQEYDKQ